MLAEQLLGSYDGGGRPNCCHDLHRYSAYYVCITLAYNISFVTCFCLSSHLFATLGCNLHLQVDKADWFDAWEKDLEGLRLGHNNPV